MVIFLIIFLHLVVLFFGMKSLKGGKLKREIFLFLFIILLSTYMGIAKPASLPLVPLIEVIDFIFEPIGRWIENALGG